MLHLTMETTNQRFVMTGWLAPRGADSHPFPPRPPRPDGPADGGGQPLILTRYSIFRVGVRDGVAFLGSRQPARAAADAAKTDAAPFFRCRARTHRLQRNFGPESGWLARAYGGWLPF